MQYLYPTSQQYPIDAVTGEIVRALEARNFNIPGITVEFHRYGSGEQHVGYLRTATGASWSLRFGRPQGTLPGGQWSDVAAISDVTIPRRKITGYSDGSGPTLHLYVGDDWPGDFARFASDLVPGLHDKMDGRPRKYVRYSGSHSRGTLRWQRDCFDRDHGPDDEPTEFASADIFAEFNAYLRNVVLAEILAVPETDERTDPFPEPPAIPWPADIGPLFCFAEDLDVRRIRQGQCDQAVRRSAPHPRVEPPSANADLREWDEYAHLYRETELPAHERYGMQGNGRRLMPLDIANDGTVPDIAYEGFLWCGLGEPAEGATIPGHYRWRDRERHVLRILPTRANNIFVADHGAYEARRAELSAAIKADATLRGVPERARFTDAEVADFVCARGRTIVPITEYRGGFAQPVVLVARELGFDEVTILRGRDG